MLPFNCVVVPRKSVEPIHAYTSLGVYNCVVIVITMTNGVYINKQYFRCATIQSTTQHCIFALSYNNIIKFASNLFHDCD